MSKNLLKVIFPIGCNKPFSNCSYFILFNLTIYIQRQMVYVLEVQIYIWVKVSNDLYFKVTFNHLSEQHNRYDFHSPCVTILDNSCSCDMNNHGNI